MKRVTFWCQEERNIKDKTHEKRDVESGMMDSKVNILCDELKGKLLSIREIEDKSSNYFRCKQKDQMETNTNKLHLSFRDLNDKVEKLTKLYEKTSFVEKADGDPFFYQKPLPDIFKEEEGFTASLTDYTRKQFFGGISDLAGGQDKSKYEMLDSSRPETFLVKGNDGDVKEREREELKRLQSIYLKSKQNCINAEMSHVKYKKAVEVAERQLKMLKTLNNFDVTHEQLAELIESRCNETNACQNKLRACYGSELMSLLQNLQMVSSTKVIQGDYNLKLMRQDYFISKQNEVTKQLLMQYSRNYLLTLLYEMDFKAQTKTHHTLSSLESMLSSEIESIQKRISLLDQMVCNVKSEKQIITSNDDYMNRIYEASHSKQTENPELYRSYNNLNSAVSALARAHKMCKKELEDAEAEKSELDEQIQSILNNAEQLMRSSKEKSNEELTMIVANVEENLEMAQIQINEVIKDIMEKKHLLTVDRMEEIKRSIFTDFLNDPAKLKRNLEDLTARVNSASVSAS